MRSLKAYPGMAKPDMADSHVGHPEGEAETSNPMITTMSGSTPMTKPIPSAFFQPCQRTSEYQVMEGIIIEPCAKLPTPRCMSHNSPGFDPSKAREPEVGRTARWRRFDPCS